MSILMTPEDFAKTARDVFEPKNKGYKKKNYDTVDKEICKSLIGTSYEICSELWALLDPELNISKDAKPMHLLWALLFLKNYASEKLNKRVVGGTNETTFRKWSWAFVQAIRDLEPEVIIWNNRFRKWDGQSVCLISVDGVDCAIKEPYPFDTGIFSKKINGPGLKYEVGISIQTCDIVWINGPFKAGMNDVTIFKHEGLRAALCDGEGVECDKGYKGDNALKNNLISQSRHDRIQKNQVRARHEIVNGRLKNFRILDDVFRSTGVGFAEKHEIAFRAVAVIVQLGFELQGHLYDITYNAVYS